MKTSQMKLEAKSKTHKNKKQTKQIIKRSLCILIGFFLILITYFDLLIEKDEISLITYNNNNLYTNVEKNDLLNIIEKETGIIVFINDKKTTNRIINLIYKTNTNENIYLYNLKNDEPHLELNKEDELVIKKEPSELYNKLINKLNPYIGYNKLIKKDKSIVKTTYKMIYTPMVLFVKNGKILLSHYISENEVNDEELLNVYKQGSLMLKEYNS